MRSPVNWAVLGLTIERSSYGYEILQRFERNYGAQLKLSSPSQVYTALDSLVGRGMIEAARERASETASRQPRLHYRATNEGIERYREHLIAQVGEDCKRATLFARELAALKPEIALCVLDEYERVCLARARRPRLDGATHGSSLADRLAAEEERLIVEAKLPWIEYARKELARQARGL